MTRSPLLLAASLVLVATAAVGCGSDDDPGESADLSVGATDVVECEEGSVGAGSPATDPAVRITSYEASLTIADEGSDLAAQETLTVEFDDAEHHGIVRDFSGDDIPVSEVTGTLDGAPSGSFAAGVGGGRLTIGDAGVTLTAGEHVVGIDYTAESVLEPSTDVDQDSQLDAAVIDPGWSLDIADATVTIVLPADSGDVSCIAGAGASASISGAGTPTLVLTADEVPAGTGVRVLVGVDADE